MSSVLSKKPSVQPFELLLDQKQIARRIAELGAQITTDYAGQVPVLIGVLKGCSIFIADLMRNIKLPVELEFIAAASYRKGTRIGDNIQFGGELSVPIKGRHLLLVEGIVDSGRTVTVIMERLRKLEPASIEIVTLMDKPRSHRTKIDVKYRGFSIGNEFVIGFGLDNTQKYRNLPFIGRLLDE
ncbi:MAG: hypoxanthine phosphoribosyltransferase [candidate division Zixibacteria bacterium]|nr:hypoxanthine phosphoribosyltransferase [candidate division Zixibacteria bacterium]